MKLVPNASNNVSKDAHNHRSFHERTGYLHVSSRRKILSAIVCLSIYNRTAMKGAHCILGADHHFKSLKNVGSTWSRVMNGCAVEDFRSAICVRRHL